MADLHSDVRNLADLVEEVTKACVMIQGTTTHPGLIQQLEQATKTAREMSERLGTPHALIEEIKQLSAYSQELPEHLLSKVDSAAFRAALSRVIVEVTGAEIEKLQQIELDHLDAELKFRGDRLADDIFTRKIAPAMTSANALARAKTEAESYKTRAETAEKLLRECEVLSKKTETNLLAQIEHIRLEAKKPSGISAAFIFGAGWATAVFASEVWAVFTHWVVQQPIPAWFLP